MDTLVKWSEDPFITGINHQSTDSQITLHWIHNEEKTLEQWLRNRVIEIQRFTSKQQWYYLKGSNF